MNRIDIKAGDLTYGQRIELGGIFSDPNSDDLKRFKRTMECLHGAATDMAASEELVGYFEEIIEGLTYWAEQENALLKYEPSDEEKRAGIEEYSRKVGEFGTVKSLAKAYNQDPDTILQWKYSKVFGILYTDLEEYKFNKRFNKELEKRNAKKKR